jgi:phosphopantetheinyl transferase (holo-ACP synthase)
VIIGVGVDIVDVERFKWMMRKSASMIDRTFSVGEARDAKGTSRSA